MQQGTVLISAPCHEWLLEKLGATHTISNRPDIGYEELLDAIGHATGLVVSTRLPIDATVLQRAANLKWIARLGSGLELIDVPLAESMGIRVISSPEGNRNTVAEHALGMALSLLNKLQSAALEVKDGKWIRAANRGTELRGKTVGIIGYGHTGSAFARLLQPFGVTVLAYDKYRFGFGSGYIKEAQAEQIQRYADIISWHVPLTPETRHMANLAFFNGCAHKPLILNTSRGQVLNLADLKTALLAGSISSAGLDVLENEKPDTWQGGELELMQWLLAQPNVLITPHIAGYSREAHLRMAQVVYEKLTGTFTDPFAPK
jgi:D-3-phosphoglycerate dehydrogenase